MSRYKLGVSNNQPSTTVYIYALYEKGLPERIYRYVSRTRDIAQYNSPVPNGPLANWKREVHQRGNQVGREILQELVNPTREEASDVQRKWTIFFNNTVVNKKMAGPDRRAKAMKLSRQLRRATTADAAKQNND